MESTILQEALKQGVWAALFVGLLFYVLRTQERREVKAAEENRLREERLINALDKAQTNNQQLAISVERINSELADIKDAIDEIGGTK